MGAGYPREPGAKIFARGSPEESEVITAVEDILNRNGRLADFEGLAEAEYRNLNESEQSDWNAAVFLRALRNRIDPPPAKRWLP